MEIQKLSADDEAVGRLTIGKDLFIYGKSSRHLAVSFFCICCAESCKVGCPK
ncbi:hypothetical protein Barb4_02706 [Bacteroidales bacterium Barb4]|nr:hypothetical protein Barb4_02706 [Bacteroidales bacterium Barb4]